MVVVSQLHQKCVKYVVGNCIDYFKKHRRNMVRTQLTFKTFQVFNNDPSRMSCRYPIALIDASY